MRSPTTSGTSQLQALPHPQEAQTLASPPIESFAYRPNAAASPKPAAASSAVVNLSDVDDFYWDLNDAAPAANKDDDDWNISDGDEEVAAEDLEDDFDEEEEHPVVTERALPPRSTRGHRVIIDEDSYLEDEGFGVEDDDDDEEEEFGVVEKKGNGRGEEPDVLGKALVTAHVCEDFGGAEGVVWVFFSVDGEVCGGGDFFFFGEDSYAGGRGCGLFERGLRFRAHAEALPACWGQLFVALVRETHRRRS